jgi:hypothetical protein
MSAVTSAEKRATMRACSVTPTEPTGMRAARDAALVPESAAST